MYPDAFIENNSLLLPHALSIGIFNGESVLHMEFAKRNSILGSSLPWITVSTVFIAKFNGAYKPLIPGSYSHDNFFRKGLHKKVMENLKRYRKNSQIMVPGLIIVRFMGVEYVLSLLEAHEEKEEPLLRHEEAKV